MRYELQITQSSGETKRVPLADRELTIGSTGASQVCLLGEAKLLPKHILIAPSSDQCWVSTAKGAPLWDQEGRAVDGAFVPWGSRLSLGACVFELQAIESTGDLQPARNLGVQAADKPREANKAPSPIILMLLLCTLAYAAFGIVSQPETMANKLGDSAPKLFESAQSCEGTNFAHRARSAEDDAVAKSERAVFDKQDGVSAVELFAISEACYLAGQETSDAEYVAAKGNELRKQLEEEYKLLRLRLARALSDKDDSLASSQVKQLLVLLQHRSQSSFVLSLRRLDLQLSKKEMQP